MSDPITPDRLARFAPGCDAAATAPALGAAAREFRIDTPERLVQWLGQLHHESGGFTRLEENLYYSPERLMAVWPHRFPDRASALTCARNAVALAERVYGGRQDLGNTHVGDGYRFRGRGYIQTTGRANYERAAQALGLDLLDDPDLLKTPRHAARAAGLFWRDRGLNAAADRGDTGAITRAINGGMQGAADRAMQVSRARIIFLKESVA